MDAEEYVVLILSKWTANWRIVPSATTPSASTNRFDFSKSHPAAAQKARKCLFCATLYCAMLESSTPGCFFMMSCTSFGEISGGRGAAAGALLATTMTAAAAAARALLATAMTAAAAGALLATTITACFPAAASFAVLVLVLLVVRRVS